MSRRWPDVAAQDAPIRFLPPVLGVAADVVAISGLIFGGGQPIVWATSLGAVVAGVFIIWRCWGTPVGGTLLAGVAVAAAGAGVFGFSLAMHFQSDPVQPPPSPPAPSTARTWLTDLAAIEGGYGDWRRGEATFDGRVHQHSIIGSTCSKSDDGHEVFAIDRRFQRFQVTLGIADGAPAGTVTRFVVKLDGRELASRDLRSGEVGLLDVPVADGKQLLLQVDNIESECSATAVWGEAILR